MTRIPKSDPAYWQQKVAALDAALKVARGRRIKGEVESLRRQKIMAVARLVSVTPARSAA
jgi:hypothetical protein